MRLRLLNAGLVGAVVGYGLMLVTTSLPVILIATFCSTYTAMALP